MCWYWKYLAYLEDFIDKLFIKFAHTRGVKVSEKSNVSVDIRSRELVSRREHSASVGCLPRAASVLYYEKLRSLIRQYTRRDNSQV